MLRQVRSKEEGTEEDLRRINMRKPEMEKIVLFGNSGFAEHMYYLLTYDSPYEVAAFTVDAKYIKEDKLFGLPVVPFETLETVYPPSDYKMSVAVSFQRINRLREEKYFQAKTKGYRLVNYLSSRAISYPGLAPGDNCIILESAIIAPSVEIGNNVIVASGAIIGHHAILRDHCFISPGAVILGGVIVEEYCLIGANATVKEEVTISRECLVGSGVSITRNTVERGVYTNPPAELYPKRSDELRTWLMWPVREHKSSPARKPK
jgi:sugar O-acyltransferase (sialic acid O-acetyltransferase NeuD family)